MQGRAPVPPMAPALPELEEYHPKISLACAALNPNEGWEGDKGREKGSVSPPPPCTGLGPTARLLTREQILQTTTPRQQQHRGARACCRMGPWYGTVPASLGCHGAAPERKAGDAGGWMGLDSPQTFAAGQGPGIGRGCWRRVTSWAAACLCCLRSVAAGCLSVPPRLSAVGSTAGRQPPALPAPCPWQVSGLRACPPPLCLALPVSRVTLDPAVPKLRAVPHGSPCSPASRGNARGDLCLLGIGNQPALPCLSRCCQRGQGITRPMRGARDLGG